MKKLTIAIAALLLTSTVALAQDDPPAADAGAVIDEATGNPETAPAPAAPTEEAASEEAEKPAETAAAEPEQPADEVGDDPVGTLGEIVQAVRDGNWKAAAAGFLILLVWAARKFGNKIAFFRSDRGGPVLVFLMSFAGALGTAMMAGEPISLKLFLTAAEVALMAMGGFVALKRIIWPEPTEPPAKTTLPTATLLKL